MHVMEVRYDRRPPIERREMYDDLLAEQMAYPVMVRVKRGDKASTAIAQVADEEESTVILVGKHGRGTSKNS